MPEDGPARGIRPRVRYRYRFRFAGLLYLAMTLLLGVAAATRPNNLLVWIFGVMLGAILVSGIVSGFMLMRLEIRRLDLRTAVVGRTARLRYELTNRSRFWSAFGLSIREHPVGTADGWEHAIDAPRTHALHVDAGASVRAEAWIEPRRRGVVRFREVAVSTRFPFGLIEKVLRFDLPATLLVRPRVHSLRRDLLEAMRGRAEGISDLGRCAGAGGEFLGVREYRPGDSLRRLAWKRLAGTNRLAVVERSSGGPPRLRLALNLGRGASEIRLREGQTPRDAEEVAIELAASIAAAAVASGFETGLEVVGVAAPRIEPSSGRRGLERIMDVLAGLDLTATRRRDSIPGGSGLREVRVVVEPGESTALDGDDRTWRFGSARLDSLRSSPREATA
ncbi:MAG: DUF58 domain-containing protein [Planctomycetota bacterium]|jgi:uncharacterized protein (DUF58 family)